MSKQTFSLQSYALPTELTKVHATKSAQNILSKIYDDRKNVPKKPFYHILYFTLTIGYRLIKHELHRAN